MMTEPLATALSPTVAEGKLKDVAFAAAVHSQDAVQIDKAIVAVESKERVIAVFAAQNVVAQMAAICDEKQKSNSARTPCQFRQQVKTDQRERGWHA